MKILLLAAAGFLASTLAGCVVTPVEPVYVAPAKHGHGHHHHHRSHRWRGR